MSSVDVFVSYASKDTAVANAVVAALERQQITCWIAPRDVIPGSQYADGIVRAINGAKFLVLVLSESAVASPHVGKEIERASSKQRPIIALKIDAASLTPALEYFLSESQWIDAETLGMEAASAKLVEAVRSQRLGMATHRSGAVPGGPNRSAQRMPWMVAAAAGVIALGLAYVLIDKRLLSHEAGAQIVPPVPPATPHVAASDKSVAVLPFVDMSEKKDQEYFSDGLSEELIDMLTKVQDLRVPARTSSFYFKGQHATIAQIAKELNVANVLEGSVRRAGNTIRVTVQLIRADNGYHLWSETYDRDLQDVFKVQDDIARMVVEKLKLTLANTLPTTQGRTTTPEVHNLYLQGRYLVQNETEVDLQKAVDHLQRAIEIDPGYAPAWGELAGAYFRQMANGLIPVAQGLDKVNAAAEKGAALDPSLAQPQLLLGAVKMTRDHDWAGARIAFDKALQADPNNPQALFFDAFLTRTVGSDTGLVKFQRALDRDPLNLLNRRYMARALYHVGRLAEAEAAIRQVLAMSPSFPAAHYELGRILLAQGKPEAALSEMQAESSPGWKAFGLPLALHALGRTDEANAALAEIVSHSAGSEFQVAEAYAYFGDPDQAFHWLDQAVRKRDPGIQWLRSDPLLKGITSDPRYGALLRRLGLPPD